MQDKTKINFRKLYTHLDVIIIIFLWISIFFGVFYIGSINAGIWGKWQGLEIVFPIIISFVITSIIIVPLYLIKTFFINKKKRKQY